MRIIVDGDACPNKSEIKELAIKYHKEMLVFIDYAHSLEDNYFQVIQCEIGHDSVDMAILNKVHLDDLVITQDYGLASLILSKGAQVLHVSGLIIDHTNIESLLFTRYISAKQRRAHIHLKGPAKRTNETKNKFLYQLEKILKENS